MAEHPWREPGIRCWWTFVRDDTRDDSRDERTPPPRGVDRDAPTGDELRLLSIVVASARPVLLDELVRAFPSAREATEALIDRLRDRGLVVTPRRQLGRVVAPTIRGRALRRRANRVA